MGPVPQDLDTFAAESQRRAAQATAEGRFDNEIVAVRLLHRDKETGAVTESDELVGADEGIREGTTVETLANLKPAFKPDGKVTAGNSSQITDGASAALVMSEEKAAALGRPRARFHTFELAGVDPVTMTGPIPATHKVLERSGLSIDDIDLFEVNEAFASVVLAWQRETARTWQDQRQRRRHRPRPPARARGPSCWPPCSTSWSARGAATGCRRCARAAAWPTPRSSSAWTDGRGPGRRGGRGPLTVGEG